MKSILIICIALICTCILHAQNAISVGEHSIVNLQNISNDTVTYQITLSNPTVVYIDSILINNQQCDLQRISDSKISWTLHEAGTISIHLQALAGNDSVTYLHIQALNNTEIMLDSSIIVMVKSSGTPLPYLRIAMLSDNAPNPSRTNEQTTWNYRIDRESAILFDILSIDGKILAHFQEYQLSGYHSFTLLPSSFNACTGTYFIRMHTNTGTIIKKWSVAP